MKSLKILSVAALCISLQIEMVFAQESEIRVGIPAFPSVGGNSLGLVNLPSLYTFAALFDALTYVDWSGEAKPQLADSWEAISPTVWRFSLRPNIRFSNGEPFNASTVASNIDIIKSPIGQTFVTASELAYIKSARVIEDLVAEIETTQSTPFLPHDLSMLRFVPPMYWQDVGVGKFALEPIGTAPFKLDRWTGTELQMVAWQGA